MNILRKNYRKFWDQFLNARSLFSAITYSLLLFTIVFFAELSTVKWLYMEVYNVTLLYVIINMILFSKDILHPKSDLLFSNELIEILLILAFATILTISLYLSKDSINALKTSHVIIQTNAIIVIIISLFMWKKTQLNAPLNKT